MGNCPRKSFQRSLLHPGSRGCAFGGFDTLVYHDALFRVGSGQCHQDITEDPRAPLADADVRARDYCPLHDADWCMARYER